MIKSKVCPDWCVGQPTFCISPNDCSRSWKAKFLLSFTSSTWKMKVSHEYVVFYLIYPPGSPEIPLQTWNLWMNCLLNMVAYILWQYLLGFFPIFIYHCENSIVTCLPLLTKDGLYLSLYIMWVPPPFLSSLGMFPKQYPAFLNLFMLSQSSSFTHVYVGKQKSISSIYSGVILSIPFH